MVAAVVGMAGNLAVSRYKKHVALQIHSVTMEAEANHSWLDMISSLAALIELVGVALGYHWADPITDFAVTLFILHVGWEVTSEIFHHPMDGVEPEYIEAARQAAVSVSEVRDVAVRGGWMGRSLTLEVEGQLPGETPLARAEEIGQAVEAAAHDAVGEARHIRWIPRRYSAPKRRIDVAPHRREGPEAC